MTVFEEIIHFLKKACVINRHEQVAPAAVLWTDKERQWDTVISMLKGSLPELITIGPISRDRIVGSETIF